jgi:hypothetical protein
MWIGIAASCDVNSSVNPLPPFKVLRPSAFCTLRSTTMSTVASAGKMFVNVMLTPRGAAAGNVVTT